MESDYIIAGPIINEEPTWYKIHDTWVTDIEQATKFPRAILVDSLPVGGEFYAKIDSDCRITATYTPLGGSRLFSVKVVDN